MRRRNLYSGTLASHTKLFGALLLSFSLLAGCSSEGMDDLNQYIKQVKSKRHARIDPIPEIKAYESYTYNPRDTRDPFASLVSSVDQKPVTEDQPDTESGLRPDYNRNRDELEAHPLDSLRMVGSIEREDGIWAIILASNGTIHRVRRGNYLGQNHGQIMVVNEQKIQLKEIIPDGLGGWMERESAIALSE